VIDRLEKVESYCHSLEIENTKLKAKNELLEKQLFYL
jgi:hypothetical protein